MGKLWLVARQEYLGRVRQRSFLVGTLSILAIIAVIMGITAIIAMGGRDDRPLGYVDHAGRVRRAGRRPRPRGRSCAPSPMKRRQGQRSKRA